MSYLVPVNHTDQANNRLLYQFNTKDNILNLLSSIMTSIQSLEDVAISFSDIMFSIDDSTNGMLDIIGKLVGATRNGQTDSEYRESIKFQILLNTSEGTPNDLLVAIEKLTNATSVDIDEYFPGTVILYTNGDAPTAGVFNTLQGISPITTAPILIIHDPDNDSWIPSSYYDVEDDILSVLPSYYDAPQIGGLLANIYINKGL